MNRSSSDMGTPTKKAEDDERYSEQETERRMNDALKRALNMPPKPHKPDKAKRRPTKRRSKAAAGRLGQINATFETLDRQPFDLTTGAWLRKTGQA